MLKYEFSLEFHLIKKDLRRFGIVWNNMWFYLSRNNHLNDNLSNFIV